MPGYNILNNILLFRRIALSVAIFFSCYLLYHILVMMLIFPILILAFEFLSQHLKKLHLWENFKEIFKDEFLDMFSAWYEWHSSPNWASLIEIYLAAPMMGFMGGWLASSVGLLILSPASISKTFLIFPGPGLLVFGLIVLPVLFVYCLIKWDCGDQWMNDYFTLPLSLCHIVIVLPFARLTQACANALTKFLCVCLGKMSLMQALQFDRAYSEAPWQLPDDALVRYKKNSDRLCSTSMIREVVRESSFANIYSLLYLQSIYRLILDGKLTASTALALNHEDRRKLGVPEIRKLISADVITVDDVTGRYTVDELAILCANSPHLRWLGYTVEQVLQREQRRIAAEAPWQPTGRQPYNNSQSTHTSSVHQASSATARRLQQRYRFSELGLFERLGLFNYNYSLEGVLATVETYLNGLSDNAGPMRGVANSISVHAAAKRCLTRFKTDNAWDYVDAGSGVSIKKLVALVFLGVVDNSRRIEGCTKEDALSHFVEGLYEIQRGNNLNERGVDNVSRIDRSICPGGAFNKLVEKVRCFHQDGEMIFMTLQSAGAKLQIVAVEEAEVYLNSLQGDEREQCLSNLRNDGTLESIKDAICQNVSCRIMDEFSSLFQNNINHTGFTGLLEQIQYVPSDSLLQRLNTDSPLVLSPA
jgi:hypothetical protein